MVTQKERGCVLKGLQFLHGSRSVDENTKKLKLKFNLTVSFQIQYAGAQSQNNKTCVNV